MLKVYIILKGRFGLAVIETWPITSETDESSAIATLGNMGI